MSVVDSGPPAATIEESLRRAGPRLKRVLASYRIPSEDAEDLLQQSLLALVHRRDQVRDPESWLIGTLKAGYGLDDYVGLAREDNRYFVSGGVTYKMNREMQIKGEVRHDWLTSSQPGNAYDATSVLLTLRLQR